MKTVYSATSLLLAGLWAAGCPNGDGEPAVDVTLDAYCQQVAEVACHNIWHCCTGQQIEDALGITISIEPPECRRDVELICADRLAPMLWAAYKGSVRLQEQDATACMGSMLLDGACFQHVSEIPWDRWCGESHWKGTLDPGQECLYSFECKQGAYCAADRKCKAYPKQGQECEAGICQPGLFCNAEGKCEYQKSSGQRCENADWCGAELYCEFNDEGEGTCLGLKSLGVTCKGHYQCHSEFCIPGLCDNGMECFEEAQCPGNCTGSGNACYSDYDCQPYCAQSHYPCETDWDCAEGESCITQSCQQRCLGESVCAERWTVIDYCTDSLEGLLDGGGDDEAGGQ